MGFRSRFLVFFASCLIALATGASAQEDDAPRCGGRPIAIAQMQWPSASILAYIHAQIIDEQLGCETQVVAGDLSATIASMANARQPAVAPELWITRVAAVWNTAMESQNIVQAGDTFTGAPLEGWFVPDFVIENHPELDGATKLKDYVNVFAADGRRPRFISCPADWACALINRNLLKALGLDTRFEIVEPENRFALDRLIGEAMSGRDPILFYYWQPNAVLAQFQFRQLDLGAYSAEAVKCLAARQCETPEVSGFPNEPVVVALASWVREDAPEILAYFNKARMPVAEMNQLLAWQNEQNATPEATAQRFVSSRAEVWQAWVAD